MGKCKLTKEELEIVDRLDTKKIEMWGTKEKYWKIYKAVIKATKKNLTKHNNDLKKVCSCYDGHHSECSICKKYTNVGDGCHCIHVDKPIIKS